MSLLVTSRQFIKYLLTGGIAWLADMLVFLLLYLAIGIPVAQFIARAAGAVVGFLLNKSFTFGDRSQGRWGSSGQWLRYLLLWAFNWGLTVAGILALHHWLHLQPGWAKIAVDAVVIPGNFLVMKYLVFNTGQSPDNRP